MVTNRSRLNGPSKCSGRMNLRDALSKRGKIGDAVRGTKVVDKIERRDREVGRERIQ